MSFNGSGGVTLNGAERCSNGATVTETPFSNVAMTYSVNSDGSFTRIHESPDGLHGQIVLDGSTLLMSGTTGTNNDYLDNSYEAVIDFRAALRLFSESKALAIMAESRLGDESHPFGQRKLSPFFLYKLTANNVQTCGVARKGRKSDCVADAARSCPHAH
jgi:hypothetical protein